jgi:hypothetical protein
MSVDLLEFTLLYYFDSSPAEIVEFINNYTYSEVKYHIKLLKNLEMFNKFFKRYTEIDINKINNIKNLRYIHFYRKHLINNGLLKPYDII